MLSLSLFLVACQPNQTETIPSTAVATDETMTATSSFEMTGPTLANCPVFPADSIWNRRVDSLPTHPMSDAWIDSIGRDESFHMDFGSGEWDGGPIEIPYNVVAGSTVQKEAFEFYYPDESDAGPYPRSSDSLIEYGSDHHILVVDTDTCTLYEIYDVSLDSSQWSAGSGAIWDLTSNALRPETWTSADTAGLPILPGLVRYDEILLVRSIMPYASLWKRQPGISGRRVI